MCYNIIDLYCPNIYEILSSRIRNLCVFFNVSFYLNRWYPAANCPRGLQFCRHTFLVTEFLSWPISFSFFTLLRC